jgi:hypothetical protein
MPVSKLLNPNVKTVINYNALNKLITTNIILKKAKLEAYSILQYDIN